MEHAHCWGPHLHWFWFIPFLFMILMFVTTMIVYFCGLVIARQSRGNWGQPIVRLDTGGSRSRPQKIALAVAVSAPVLAL